MTTKIRLENGATYHSRHQNWLVGDVARLDDGSQWRVTSIEHQFLPPPPPRPRGLEIMAQSIAEAAS